MLIGYARVSQDDQNLDLQFDALTQAGCEKIFKDHITGRSVLRPGFSEMMKVLRANDILVVWRLDRLGRSLSHLIELVNQLEEGNQGFVSLTESIDTTTPAGKLIFHMFGALAEFERSLIRERTLAGLASARARGRLGGRPMKLSTKQQEVAVELYRDKKHSILEICRIMGISKTTLYNYVKKANAQFPKGS
jgi:DNA invertase Pin-like site-specific DNA recombinase